MRFLNLLVKNNIKRNSTKTGFTMKTGLTMVESLVAISILTIAVIGPLSIIAQALQTSYYTRDQMTAHYLAQEAVEYVRNMRDRQGILITKDYLDNMGNDTYVLPNWLNADTSLFGIENVEIPNSGSAVRYSMTKTNNSGAYKFTTCSGSSAIPCPTLKKNQQGIFGYNDEALASDSIFTREIYFERGPISGDNIKEIIMTVNVYWKNGSYPAQITIRESLTNWPSVNGL